MRAIAAAILFAGTTTLVFAREDGRPSLSDRPDVKAACAYVASMKGDEIIDYTLGSGVFDIDGDGSFETVLRTRADGSMGGNAHEIRDASGNLIEWSEVDVLSGSDLLLGARWMPFRGRAYLLGFTDEKAGYLVRLSYPDADRTLRIGCRFETKAEGMLMSMDSAHIDVCEQIAEGKAEEIKVAATTDYRTVQPSMSVSGEVSVDLTGKGLATRLYKLSYSSGAGRGCDATFFTTAAAVDDQHKDTEHQSLMELQGIYVDDAGGEYSPPDCVGLSRRWLRVKGGTYLETRYPKGGPDRVLREVHQVQTLAGGQSRKVCDATFTRSLSLVPEDR